MGGTGLCAFAAANTVSAMKRWPSKPPERRCRAAPRVGVSLVLVALVVLGTVIWTVYQRHIHPRAIGKRLAACAGGWDRRRRP